MTRRLIVAGFAFIAIVSATVVQAAPVLLVDVNGKLTGAENVQVGANLYDLEFVDGTCGEVFRSCDLGLIDLGLPDFAFTTEGDARLAAQAILDHVFVDAPLGNFDTGVQNIRGCIIPEVCTAYVPFFFDAGQGPLSTPHVDNAIAVNSMGGFNGGTDSTGVSPLGLTFNTAPVFGLDAFLWARFTLADIGGPFPDPPPVTPVPEPASFLMLGTGLAAAIARYRRHR
jgi:hypothetical protein